MSIKSDKWIQRMCTPPDGTWGMGDAKLLVNKIGDQYVIRENGLPLIMRYPTMRVEDCEEFTPFTDEQKAQYKPMIEPFEPRQIKKRMRMMNPGDPVGFPNAPHITNLPEYIEESIISYGTSSYGYDIRCADEFKIFTNINSTIVDPKNFDQKNFVDFKGDVCIIPPNSFALARTVEYFRIPRNILTVCLGKSTYARCFTGDTRVSLVDGTSASFTELVERSEKGERFWGYAVSEQGKIEVAELTAPRKVGHEKVIEVVLDNEQIIRCTPDHMFMLRSGRYVEAKDLQPEDSLMPLYRGEYRGYESVYQPVDGRMISTHWMADLWNVRNGIYEHIENTHRHHQDLNQRNNRPDNIARISGDEHHQLHNAERWSTQEARIAHGNRIIAALDQLRDDEFWFWSYVESQRANANLLWHAPEHAQARERILNNLRDLDQEAEEKRRNSIREHYLSESVRAEHAAKMRKAWEGDEERRNNQREFARKLNLREELTATVVKAALETAKTIRGAARLLSCDRSVFRRFPEIMSWFYGFKMATNHKVVAVREVEGTHDVYCLTVPEFGNFALESGVFVKNCGIIVNVTPFEPEWEGYVTLEFSNTTPLPAKIYANEGVAQVLFLQSDETCEVSYADRGGKYQGQEGVTLPRT